MQNCIMKMTDFMGKGVKRTPLKNFVSDTVIK